MKKVKKIVLFFLSVVILNTIFWGASWLIETYKFFGILLFPVKISIGVITLFGFVVSFYLIWKLKIKNECNDWSEKSVIWFLRVGTIFLTTVSILQVVLMLNDVSLINEENVGLMKYNIFHDLGFQSAIWYISFMGMKEEFGMK